MPNTERRQPKALMTDAIPSPTPPAPWSIILSRVLPKPMHLPSVLLSFVGGEIVDLVLQTGPVAKTVLLLLIAFSVLSWAVILSKWRLIRRARGQSGRFVRAFRKAQRLQDIASVAEQFRPSPLVGVFEGGFEEYKRQVGPSGIVKNPASLQPAMQIAASEELTRF